MYYIQHKETGKYFHGYVHGCVVWKEHISRASCYTTSMSALFDVGNLDLQNLAFVVKVEEE